MYLYIKTHATGLKYLGKTVGDPYKYKGSGTHWLRHLNKHGEEHTTEILFETDDKELFKEKALYYSNLYNVVESKEWANIVPEQGDGGNTSMSPAYQSHIASGNFLYGEKNGFYGKKHTEETKRMIGEKTKIANTGKVRNGEQRQRYSENNSRYWAGKKTWNAGKTGVQRKRTPEEMASFSKAVTYEGVEYPSINAASRATGLSPFKIKKATSK
jgi:hypothetical protein